MPHAHHFLERLDRVTREQTEFALTLDRDHEAVSYILDHVNLLERTERVALSIADPVEGPFVGVTRDGRFVTSPGWDAPGTSGRLTGSARGATLAGQTAFEPLLGVGPFMVCLELGVEASKTRLKMLPNARRVVIKGSSIKPLERLDRLEWGVAHSMMLSGAPDRKLLDGFLRSARQALVSPTIGCSAQMGTTFSLRAAWAAARFGKPTVARAAPTPGRNDPCSCGNGEKYKKCHDGPNAPPPTPVGPVPGEPLLGAG